MEHIDAQWRKSSYSGTSGNNCIEAGIIGDLISVRDSKDCDGAVLRFAPDVWRVFAAELKQR